MAINIYSKDSVDSLLSPKLSISSLTNAAATTLNATAPTTDQVLSFDGTELKWATVAGGGITSDKAIANAFASSMWYAWDGYDYSRNGVVNTLYISGSYLSAGISDGTTFAAGFPATNATLDSGSYWYVSINGTLSDLFIFSP